MFLEKRIRRNRLKEEVQESIFEMEQMDEAAKNLSL